MKEQTNGEKLTNRPWKSFSDELPSDKSCVEFATHQTFGLGNWCKDKGFVEVFITYGPHEFGEHYKNPDSLSFNNDSMWWREICNWPYYGEWGCDSELMKPYIKG